jgi:hypothetical protein
VTFPTTTDAVEHVLKYNPKISMSLPRYTLEKFCELVLMKLIREPHFPFIDELGFIHAEK